MAPLWPCRFRHANNPPMGTQPCSWGLSRARDRAVFPEGRGQHAHAHHDGSVPLTAKVRHLLQALRIIARRLIAGTGEKPGGQRTTLPEKVAMLNQLSRDGG